MSIDAVATASAQERELAVELTAAVLAEAAPDEVAALDDLSAEFFADPRLALQRDDRDEEHAFGVGLELLAPYVLAVAVPLVQWLGGLVADGAKEALTPMVADRIRALFGRRGDSAEAAAAPGAGLTAEQARTAWQITVDRLQSLGVSDAEARSIGDQVAGALVVGR
ncbi:hypothetical protein [Geodermatophilus sp. SYSU D01119]